MQHHWQKIPCFQSGSSCICGTDLCVLPSFRSLGDRREVSAWYLSGSLSNCVTLRHRGCILYSSYRPGRFLTPGPAGLGVWEGGTLQQPPPRSWCLLNTGSGHQHYRSFAFPKHIIQVKFVLVWGKKKKRYLACPLCVCSSLATIIWVS